MRINKIAKYIIFIFILLFISSIGVFSSETEKHHNDNIDNNHNTENHQISKKWESVDTYRVLNFILLAGVLFVLLKKPVSESLNSRISSIKKQLEDLEKKKAYAIREVDDYKEKFNELENEKQNIIKEFVKQGESLRDKIINDAEQTAQKIEEQAKKNIEQEFIFAKKQLKDEILNEAMVLAEKMIKNDINNDDQERLINEYIEKVVV